MTSNSTTEPVQMLADLPKGWGKAVDRIRALRETKSKSSWTIADLMLELLPMNQEDTPERRYFLKLLARETGYSTSTVNVYRHVASRWPPDQRVVGARFHEHRIIAALPNKAHLLQDWVQSGESVEALYALAGRKAIEPRKLGAERFTGISKSVNAAIEILQRDDLSTDQRCSLALTVLTQWFINETEDHAAA